MGLSDKEIASFNQYIIQDICKKINCDKVVFFGKGCYNGAKSQFEGYTEQEERCE